MLPIEFYWEHSGHYIAIKWNVISPGTPLTYFNDGGGGSKVFFWGLKFWLKGIFWVNKDAGIVFLGRRKYTGIFLHTVFFIIQINNISAILLLLVWFVIKFADAKTDFFGYAKKQGRRILMLGFFEYKI